MRGFCIVFWGAKVKSWLYSVNNKTHIGINDARTQPYKEYCCLYKEG